MARRFVVLVDSPPTGPCFLPNPDTAMPELFASWEAANEMADLARVHFPEYAYQVIRLQDG